MVLCSGFRTFAFTAHFKIIYYHNVIEHTWDHFYTLSCLIICGVFLLYFYINFKHENMVSSLHEDSISSKTKNVLFRGETVKRKSMQAVTLSEHFALFNSCTWLFTLSLEHFSKRSCYLLVTHALREDQLCFSSFSVSYILFKSCIFNISMT